MKRKPFARPLLRRLSPPIVALAILGIAVTSQAQLIDLNSIINAGANTNNAVGELTNAVNQGLVTTVTANGALNLANSNLDIAVANGGVIDAAAVAALGAQVFDANGNINPNVTLGAAGLAGLGSLVGIDFCVEFGLLTTRPDICNVVLVDPDDPDNPDDVIIPDLVISDDLLAVIGAVSLPAAYSQRVLARQAMTVGTSDLNARLQRMRSGIKPGSCYNPSGSVVIDDSRTSDSGEPVSSVDCSGPTHEWEFFAQGNFGDRNEDNYTLGLDFDSNAYSGTVGMERQINDTVSVGFAATAVEADGALDRSFGRSDIEGILLSAFASHSDGAFYADALYSYGSLDHHLDRQALNGRIARSNFDSDNHLVEFNTGLNIQTGNAVTGPYANIQYVDSRIGQINERGATLLNLIVDEQNSSSLTSELGWQISLPKQNGDTLFSPHLRAAWVHQYLNDREIIGATLRNLPANRVFAFTPETVDNYGLIGAGIALQKSENTTLSIDTEYIFGDDLFAFNAGLVLSHRF